MKKKKTGFIVLFLFSLFLIPSFASSLNGYRETSPLGFSPALSEYKAQIWTPPVITDGFVKPIVNLFTDWGEGNLGINVAKYIFLLLLFVIIYGISDMLPFLNKNKSLMIAFSALVSFLAVAYITPLEIYVMLTSYTAMGIVLGSILPFLILFFFSIKTIEGGGPGILLQYWIWIAFGAWMIYKTVVIWQSGLQSSALIINVILTIAAIIMVIFNKQIRHAVFKHEREATKEAIFRGIDQANVVSKVKQKEYKNLKETFDGK